MRRNDDYERGVFTKAVRDKIKIKENAIASMQSRTADLEYEIEELKGECSPIKPGDHIRFISGDRVKYGRVLKLVPDWNGFDLQVDVLSKESGRVVANQRVDCERHEPELLEDRNLLIHFRRHAPIPIVSPKPVKKQAKQPLTKVKKHATSTKPTKTGKRKANGVSL